MTELPGFTARDRVLVAAPHPDDESIATGGALQAARAAGAACRVLIVTDGDNNPWPQRWAEKRWRIGPEERARWGARRRAEALAALGVLGVEASDVRCFGWADLGLTDALMRADAASLSRLREQFDEFRPTRLFLPALEDRHPDHSALHILLRETISVSAAAPPDLIEFGVHGTADPADAVVMRLDAAMQETKRNAIRRHATQMRLSERRFVAYAKAQEPFRTGSWHGRSNPRHPLQATARAVELSIEVDLARWGKRVAGDVFFVAADLDDGTPLRWQIDQRGAIVDTVAGRQVGMALVEQSGSRIACRVALPSPAARGWVKLSRPVPGLFVFDRFGWQTLARAES